MSEIKNPLYRDDDLLGSIHEELLGSIGLSYNRETKVLTLSDTYNPYAERAPMPTGCLRDAIDATGKEWAERIKRSE